MLGGMKDARKRLEALQAEADRQGSGGTVSLTGGELGAFLKLFRACQLTREDPWAGDLPDTVDDATEEVAQELFASWKP